LGILTIILAEIALSFPRAAAIVIIAFPGAALLFDGFVNNRRYHKQKHQGLD
jgi:uncharacterized membrane protein HdeD (DUF308 family)